MKNFQFIFALITLIFSVAAVSQARTVCSSTGCGTIVCPRGCQQQSVNGVCVINRCVGRSADESLDGLELATEDKLEEELTGSMNVCAPNTVSGRNFVQGCGNVVSGIDNRIRGNNNTVSGVNNTVIGNCWVVSGVGGFYTGNNCSN